MTTNTEATKAGDLLTITQHLILWRNRAATSRKWDRGEEVDLLGRLLEKLEAAALRTTPRPAEPALAASDDPCPHCEGSGKARCWNCDGTGVRHDVIRDSFNLAHIELQGEQIAELRARCEQLEQELLRSPSVTKFEDGSADYYWSGSVQRLLNVRSNGSHNFAARSDAQRKEEGK